MNLTGLSEKEAQEKLQKEGFNEIPHKRVGFFRKLGKWLVSPIALMLAAAALLSLYSGKIFDFFFIISLTLVNFIVSYVQEYRADTAIQKLNARLAAKVKVLRDGSWRWTETRMLVTGDVVEAGVGEIISADGIILESKNLSLNEAALTGESLPKEKKEGEGVFSGSYAATGLVRYKVTATGSRTSFGKAMLLVERPREKSSLEKDILSISGFLSVLSMMAVAVITTVFILKRAPFAELLSVDIGLVIAGIPISLPTVMTLVIEFGVIALAAKNAIVRRISALEDMANVDLVLSDKTGTLTKNEIVVQEISACAGFSEDEVLRYAYLGSVDDDRGDISKAIVKKAREMSLDSDGFALLDFVPADSSRKHATAVAMIGDKICAIALGAPQVILGLCAVSGETKKLFEKDLEDFAERGHRAVAVSINKSSKDEKNMSLAGVIALADEVEEDAAGVISFMKNNGIDVKMVTGDSHAISMEVAGKLGLSGAVLNREALAEMDWKDADKKWWQGIAGFSEVLPEDKHLIVEKAKHFYSVASTGDGINDLAALKTANVGIAVNRAVDALKADADIVLTSSGISVIKEAIMESRKIFARLYSYSLYRISESLRLIITVAVLGLVVGDYPLTALQLILLALLNDLPIISLAFDRVKVATSPAKINTKERLAVGSSLGTIGVLNSLLLFFLLKYIGLPLEQIQTIFFLKLAVGGHMLIYVTHTRERWWKFLPSKEVVWATSLTQAVATVLAITGVMMGGAISWQAAVLVWCWAFFWMQVSEGVKYAAGILQNKKAVLKTA